MPKSLTVRSMLCPSERQCTDPRAQLDPSMMLGVGSAAAEVGERAMVLLGRLQANLRCACTEGKCGSWAVLKHRGQGQNCQAWSGVLHVDFKLSQFFWTSRE